MAEKFRVGSKTEQMGKVFTALLILAAITSCSIDKGTSAHSDVGAVRGRVYTIPAGDQAGVEISLVETEFITVSNRDGSFVIAEVPEGEYELIAEKQGYGRASRKVTVKAQGSADIEATIGKLSTIVGQVQFQVSYLTDAGTSWTVPDSTVISTATGQRTILEPTPPEVFLDKPNTFLFFELSGLSPGSNWIRIDWFVPYLGQATSFYYIPNIPAGGTYAIPYTLLYPGPHTINYIRGEAMNIWGYISPANQSAIVLLWDNGSPFKSLLSGSVTVGNDGMYVVPITNLARDYSAVYLEARLTHLANGKVLELSSGLVPVDLGSYRSQPINLSLSEVR